MKNNKILILGLLLSLGVPFTSFASIDKNLRYGQRDTEVTELQEFLINKGLLKTSPSNYFGQLTFKAVKSYQLSINVSSTGFVGALTREKINSELGGGKVSATVEGARQVTATSDFKSLIAQAEEQVKLLVQDKANFLLLKKTVSEHKAKAISHSADMINSWISLTDSSASTIPTEYQKTLQLTKESLISDREYTALSVKASYEIIDLYFVSSLYNKDTVDVITSWQKDLNDCIKIWNSGQKDISCSTSLSLISSMRVSYADDIKKITSKLVEVDDLALETINNHAKKADDTVTGELERIYRIANIVAGVQANLAQIQQQAKQGYIQPLFNQSVQCYTTTNSSIFDKTRTYNTRCEAVTITPAQRCASNKAKQLSGGGLMISSQPDPACN